MGRCNTVSAYRTEFLLRRTSRGMGSLGTVMIDQDRSTGSHAEERPRKGESLAEGQVNTVSFLGGGC